MNVEKETELNNLKDLNNSIMLEKNNLSAQLKTISRTHDRIRKLAYTDYLTDLPNRIAFTDFLENILLTLREGELIAILDLDLDDFKTINDTLGHAYGDEILIDVTHRLKKALTKDDYLARIGGDEFAIILQNRSSYELVVKTIVQIQSAFDLPFTISTREYQMTISIGAVFAPKDGKTTQMLIKNVNSAMYTAKANGKSAYCFFDNSINQRLVHRLELQVDLLKAIEEKQFLIYYQPLVRLADDKIIGFEALIRWQHPTYGILSPDHFIPFAEENGMIVKIGDFVLKKACEQLVSWAKEGFDYLNIAVNFSARQFKDRNFIPQVKQTIKETHADPHQLEFEITESTALSNLDLTLNIINRLKKIGISFSLDDFGTGYSSLSYLRKLPVDDLKIDKSFLDSTSESSHEKEIVHTMIELAHILGIKVIAEGVEDESQKAFLKANLCDVVQGYYYSRPVPPEQALELLRKETADATTNT